MSHTRIATLFSVLLASGCAPSAIETSGPEGASGGNLAIRAGDQDVSAAVKLSDGYPEYVLNVECRPSVPTDFCSLSMAYEFSDDVRAAALELPTQVDALGRDLHTVVHERWTGCANPATSPCAEGSTFGWVERAEGVFPATGYSALVPPGSYRVHLRRDPLANSGFLSPLRFRINVTLMTTCVNAPGHACPDVPREHEGTQLKGAVTDANGPVADATIGLRQNGELVYDQGRAFVASADAQGQWSLSDVPLGRYEVTVFVAGKQVATRTLDATQGGEQTIDISL